MTPLLSALVAAGITTQDEAEQINRTMDADEARLHAERLMMEAMQNGLSAQQRRILDLLDETEGRPTEAQLARLWADEDDLLWLAVQEEILGIALERAVVVSVNAAVADLWMLVNEAVLDWVNDYYINADLATFGSIPNLNLTSRTLFAKIFTEWSRGELEFAGFQDGLPQLIRALTPIFGPDRAEIIAITEVSRIFSMAELQAARANEFVEFLTWQTSADELVCPICAPRQGLVVAKEDDGFRVPTDEFVGYPPAHVRCRCSLSSLTGPSMAALRAGGLVA